LYVLMEVDQI